MPTHSLQELLRISSTRLSVFSTMALILFTLFPSMASAETEPALACGMAGGANGGITLLLLFVLIVFAVIFIKLDAYWKKNDKR